MINIAAFYPCATDATSFYRGAGPFSMLRKLDPFIQVASYADVNWSVLRNCDLMFLQRPSTPTYRELAKTAKKNGLPLWVDYDDDLFNIPEWNPAYEIFKKPENQDTVLTALTLADIVTVSTPKLKEIYAPHNKNIVVIPNAFDDYVFSFSRKENMNFNKIVMWRGSKSHRKDLHSAKMPMIKLSHKWDFTWLFLGDEPRFIDDMNEKHTRTIGPMDIMGYFPFIKQVKPGIFIVPLENNVFNLSKSAIAAYEAVYAGAVVLAPDMPEWKIPGVINYQDCEDFEKKLDAMMQGEVNLWEQYDRSYEHIKEHFLLSKINKQRLEIVKQLLGK